MRVWKLFLRELEEMKFKLLEAPRFVKKDAFAACLSLFRPSLLQIITPTGILAGSFEVK